MTAYRLVYTRTASRQLDRILRYIARERSLQIAENYIARIMHRCDRIRLAPFQGTRRDHHRANVRTTGFERRVTIAFRIEADAIIVLSIAYAGRRYEQDL